MGKIKMKLNNWSLNLEDPYYEQHEDEILTESIKAIEQTSAGCYVNIVTPGTFGDPQQTFIDELKHQVEKRGIDVQNIVYVDECGCGGFVTRVYR